MEVKISKDHSYGSPDAYISIQVTMQPPVVNMTDCSLFLCFFKQSKAAVRLKEDMKKIVAVPLNEQRSSTYKKLFGVSLQDLQQQGLTENGVPAVVGTIVEYLVKHGKSWFHSICLPFPHTRRRFLCELPHDVRETPSSTLIRISSYVIYLFL